MFVVKKKNILYLIVLSLAILSIIQSIYLLNSSKKLENCEQHILDVFKTQEIRQEVSKIKNMGASFWDFYPSKITSNKIYMKGPFPLNSEHMQDIISYVRSVFEYNCKPDAEVVIFIISDPNHYLIRQDIRATYGKNHVNYKYAFSKTHKKNISHCCLYSIGYRDDIAVNQQVDYEAYTHRDILRIPVLDAYRETANKIILTPYLLDQMNNSFEYVLKSDDDTFLKINKIIPYLQNLEKEHVFIGHKWIEGPAIRNKSHKWYVSEDDHPGDVFKPYLSGSCYIFRRNIIHNVSLEHYRTSLIPMEDIHISYLVSNLGYNITNSPYFYYCTNYSQCNHSYAVQIGHDLFVRKMLYKFLKADVVHDGDD
ncbi:Beta-1,3-galactosyltransferase 1 [Thelohanellus kitauei]|uniref:Hexosyltransferase n=1 Tax=Thelohanellus kitauei TaxID=669202 RepID=A0A0C2JIM9_THEKT|nr:Beta-1,3-galactosyltransferase 1 [Thelohanellus kitauei]